MERPLVKRANAHSLGWYSGICPGLYWQAPSPNERNELCIGRRGGDWKGGIGFVQKEPGLMRNGSMNGMKTEPVVHLNLARLQDEVLYTFRGELYSLFSFPRHR